jgi:hypothetical protein
LVGFDDVPAGVRHEGTDARDDARAVGTAEKQRGSHEI